MDIWKTLFSEIKYTSISKRRLNKTKRKEKENSRENISIPENSPFHGMPCRYHL
jgi:hypothetical protein